MARGHEHPDPPDAQRRARLAFHWALAGIFLPVASLPIVWWLFWSAARRAGVRGWALGVLAVALVDTCIAASLLIDLGRFETPAPVEVRFVIGVSADPAFPDRFVVGEVRPSSPAEKAGVLVGDRLLSADSGEVRTVDQLRAAVQEARDQRAVRLRVLRAGEERIMKVVPAPADSVESAQSRELLETNAGGIESWRGRLRKGLHTLIPFGAGFLLVVGSASLRSRSFRGAGWVLAVFTVAVGMRPLASLPAETAAGGPSIGAVMLGEVAWYVLVCVLAAGTLRRIEGGFAPRQPEAPGRLGQTILLGGFYTVTVGLRTVALLTMIFGLGFEERISNPVGDLVDSSLSPGGMTLTIVVVAMLGPVAEELLFRGVLLGWLRSRCGDTVSVLLSAAMFALAHPHYGPGMVVIWVHGLVLGWARIRTGGLLAPIVLHALLNGLFVIGAWVL